MTYKKRQYSLSLFLYLQSMYFCRIMYLHSTKYYRWGLYVLVLLGLLLLAAAWSLLGGNMDISFRELPALFNGDLDTVEATIIKKIRLPRVILGVAVGGALSLSGTILQGVYRNPLVEPYTLGISGGAALGIAIAIVFGLERFLGSWVLPFMGFAGAMVIIVLVYTLGQRTQRMNTQGMLLVGVMISFIASSTMMLLMSITTTENLQSIFFWTMGSLDSTNGVLINVAFYTSLVGLVLSYFFVQPLNALRIGEEKARHLGVNTDLSIRLLFIISSLLTGVCVAVVGVIGFVGLIIPHLVRFLVGGDFRILLITSFLGGGIFLILSDILARNIIAPNELPIGVITGLIGGTVFVFMINKSKGRI